jgi:CHASE1-domain containing sensor protein/two-component sensor histidine kinase
LRKYLPAAVFLSVAAASLGTAGYSYLAAQEAGRIKFEAAADDAMNRIEARLEMHLALLRATLSLFEANQGGVTRAELDRFVTGLNIERRYPGIRGIGFARAIEPGQEEIAEAEMRRYQGRPVEVVPPETDQEMRTPIVMLTPQDERNEAAIGFDMFSEAARRDAMTRAMESGEAQASGVVELVQGLGNAQYRGFLIYLPLLIDDNGTGQRRLLGFVYAPFRAGDLFNAALGRAPLLPLSVEMHDGEMAGTDAFFTTSAPPDTRFGGSYVVDRRIEIGGRSWTARFRPTSAFEEPSSRLVPILLGLVGLLLGAALSLLARYQTRSFEAAQELQRATEKSLVERDLMLQEMKHRIKNSIARVLAIARQTANGASSVPEFTQSFSARLQAMAASQDMLTRSAWRKADLRELLRTELVQVFGNDLTDGALSGPVVEIDETTTQALGLTFHELATNALKYGRAAEGGLSVAWHLKGRELVIEWFEHGVEESAGPIKPGFGTRLIKMNVERELGGSIERRFEPEGLRIVIAVPLR